MPNDAGSNLLQDWITRAAARTPDKSWLVRAEDGAASATRRLRTWPAASPPSCASAGIGPQ